MDEVKKKNDFKTGCVTTFITIFILFGIPMLIGSCVSRNHPFMSEDTCQELMQMYLASELINLPKGTLQETEDIPSPWIALCKEEKEDWEVLAWSEKEVTQENFDSIRTVIRCEYVTRTALYSATGRNDSTSRRGTSEHVIVSYYDAKTGDLLFREELGKALPKTASGTPHYAISKFALIDTIVKRMHYTR
ncbi:hypothetical protein SDC9_54034 [bioreactor metagenome]|uniref:Uncharacterized protein n=1 Tax=bioreactor metagenome TaxID=1076179 RepID=A0A644WVM2_9ZZZZ